MNVLITGGFGFIGSNTAARFAALNHQVVVVDNLARPGSNVNREWLRETACVEAAILDVRDREAIERLFAGHRFDVVIHLAGQVAVTTSVIDPRHDFEVNALGTFNLLEATRRHCPTAIFLNASTNKVYGKLDGLAVRETRTRYELTEFPHGVSESQPLDFHSPYGCSKGSADQYVSDYARIYGIRTVNFRQSCVYGYRQFGIEDQGWVAWFMIAHHAGQEITVYGTGQQMRDILFVDDLIDCYLAAIASIEIAAGLTFNIGGGPSNTLSLLELIARLEALSGRRVQTRFAEWRPGDQPVFVADIRCARSILGWSPQVSVPDGLERLWNWVASNASCVGATGGSAS